MSITPEELDAATKDDLLDIAAELEVEVPSGANKAQIRAAIDAAQGTTDAQATAAAVGQPSAARQVFLRGEMRWNDYVAAESAPVEDAPPAEP